MKKQPGASSEAWKDVKEITTLIYSVDMVRADMKISTMRIAIINKGAYINPPEIGKALQDLQNAYPDAIILSMVLELSH